MDATHTEHERLRGHPTPVEPPGRSNGPSLVLEAPALELYLFCPRTAHSAVAAAAYDLWHHVWLTTLRQLDGLSHLDSNEFTRQDEVLSIMHEGACVSVTALRWVDRSTRIGEDDSYFRSWPRETLAHVGHSVAISSNTAISEQWRGARVRSDADEPRRLSEVVLALALRRFVESPAEEFVGVARNDRNMDRVAKALGGRAIGGLVMHGIESDIMHFPRRTLPPFERALEQIWIRRRNGDGTTIELGHDGRAGRYVESRAT